MVSGGVSCPPKPLGEGGSPPPNINQNILLFMKNMEFPDKKIFTPEIDMNQAITVIEEAKRVCSSMGGNDSEMPDLLRLQQDLLSGNITPEDASKKAQAIIGQKQDYH
jgi:hypothetical protein